VILFFHELWTKHKYPVAQQAQIGPSQPCFWIL